jgi:biotin carboxyl carrier protein
MKMKNRLKSHVAGKVLSVNIKAGDRVPKGVLLVEIG